MSPEDSGGETPNQDVQTEDLPELMLQVGLFDTAQIELQKATGEYVEEPTIQNSRNIGLCGSLVARTFRDCVKTVFETETDTQARFAAIANMMLDEDRKRTNFFRELTGCEGFEHVEAEDGKTARELMIDDLRQGAIDANGGDDFIRTVTFEFTSNLQSDINHLMEHAPPQPEGLGEPVHNRKRENLELVGKSVLDVAKLASGIVIAGWILGARRRG